MKSMKKRIGFGICIFVILAFLSFLLLRNTASVKPLATSQKQENTAPTIVPQAGPIMTTLFVPYWTLGSKALPTTYNTIAYFGITANTNGIDTKEDGYLNLTKFVRLTSANQKILLVVRLIDNDVNEKVLMSSSLQQQIITDSISTAKKYHFDGIVLDFEYNALAFDSVVQNTTKLSQNFATSIHNAHLTYYQTIYGDVFYRLRPFDVASIGENADGIFVMAYDFHKVNGTPGPNFPLHPLNDENYSFIKMVQDFTKKVSYKKLIVIFGMFGYDWTLNNKNQSLMAANSLTTAEAGDKFINCSLKSCSLSRDKNAKEEHAKYTDSNGRIHDVWFEDMTSVMDKQNYLKTQGISATGFWAYSYF